MCEALDAGICRIRRFSGCVRGILQKEEGGNEIMLTKKQINFIKIFGTVLFTMATFVVLFMSLYIVNVSKNYGKNTGIILSTSFGLTLFFITEYALLRKPLLSMIRKTEEKVSEMNFAKWIEPMDKKKTPEEILLNAVLDVGAGFEEAVPCEKIWKVVSERYGVDWMYLTGIYKKAGLKKERRICMYLMHQCSALSFDEIAEEMGMKNGVKVLHEIHELDTSMRKNEKLRNEVLEIAEELK